jgi:hypothetical protein
MRRSGLRPPGDEPLVAPRFLCFGAACGVWLGAMAAWRDATVLQTAGHAWFATWGIQAAVVLTFWTRPFSLPIRYYQPLVVGPAWLTRIPGVDRYARVARFFNPLPFDRRSPRTLEAALGAAETTHAITFTVVLALMVLATASGALMTAAFLGLWNVLFNLYPVALQRHNRARLQRLTLRRARVTSSREPAFTEPG